jgi:hypothetical protein
MEALSQTNYVSKYGACGAEAGRREKSTAHFRHPKNSSAALVAPGTQPRPIKPQRTMRSLGSAKQLAFGQVRAASAGESTSVTRDSGISS